MAEPEARLQVMTRRAAFEDDPVGFRAAWQERENEIAERIVAARRKLGSVAVPEDVMQAARLVLPHRMRRKPFQNVGSAKAVR